MKTAEGGSIWEQMKRFGREQETKGRVQRLVSPMSILRDDLRGEGTEKLVGNGKRRSCREVCGREPCPVSGTSCGRGLGRSVAFFPSHPLLSCCGFLTLSPARSQRTRQPLMTVHTAWGRRGQAAGGHPAWSSGHWPFSVLWPWGRVSPRASCQAEQKHSQQRRACWLRDLSSLHCDSGGACQGPTPTPGCPRHSSCVGSAGSHSPWGGAACTKVRPKCRAVSHFAPILNWQAHQFPGKWVRAAPPDVAYAASTVQTGPFSTVPLI